MNNLKGLEGKELKDREKEVDGIENKLRGHIREKRIE